MRNQIDKQKLVLVEGMDEKRFFSTIINHLKIKDIQIMVIGGKEKLESVLPAFILRSNFSQITSLAIIVDADNSAESAFDSVATLLKNCRQPVPENRNEYVKEDEKKVGVYILPGSAENGMLEDLCLSTVDTHPAMSCLEKYMDCLEKTLSEKPAGADKDPNLFYRPKK